MKTELFISWRYLFTKRKEKFISLISVISVLGIAIGVAALIIVIAVMAGFDRDLRDKIIGNYAHITITNYQGIENSAYSVLADKIKSNAHVTALSPYAQGQILLKEGKRYFALNLRGIDVEKETSTSKIKEYIIAGDINSLASDAIIVGRELAAYMGLGLGSGLVIYSPLGKAYNFKVKGIFASGMYDYDMNLAFMQLPRAQEVLGLGSRISAIAVKLDNLYFASKIKDELEQMLGAGYILKTWSEMNANFFAALKLEKFTMFVILTLIVLVAAFNIASTLIVTVVEKTKDIGVFKALGMTRAGVRKVFTMLGLSIGLLGIIFGVAGGLGLCALLGKYQFIKLPQDIYYIDRLPVYIQLWPDMGLIVLAALLITLAATVYPAAKAAALEPVEALRYE